MKHNKKKVIPVLLLLIIAATVGVFYWNGSDQTGEITLTGEIETTMVSNMTQVPGTILQMPVELGQPVKKGDIIAVLDDSNQQYALQQAELTLDKKNTALKELKGGADTQQIRQAQNSVAIAQSNYNSAAEAAAKAAKDYETALNLYNGGGLPGSALDQAKLLMESTANTTDAAKSQIDSARQQVSLLASGAKNTAVESLLLDIAISESQIAQIRDTLEKYTVRAQADGIVMSKNYTVGASVAQGADLVLIASDAEKYLVIYVAKEHLHLVQYDEQLDYEGNGFTGTAVVKFIDVKSRYTPKDMQTAANKNKESMKVKLLLPADPDLIPGEQVKVKINTHDKN